MEQLNLQGLIGEITPLYNHYKKNVKSIKGLDALCIMWEIGDNLKKKIEETKIPPHNLYRQIYGKAEGQKNITQKSYITREFLGRAYRIRNIFKNKKEIEKTLPDLKNFISFREAMPFFDNDKYLFKGEERKNLLILLNSDESSNSIFKKIKELQKEKIGIKNSRSQKLNELDPQKEIFIEFYNYLFNLIKNNEYNIVIKQIKNFKKIDFLKIASNTSALIQEGFVFNETLVDFSTEPILEKYIEMINCLSKNIDAKERRRFRRVILPERILKLAEMINAINSEASFKIYKNNRFKN